MDLLLYAGFFGPITEEFFFRGAGLRGLERYGKIFAIVMTAILFGLFHANFDQLFFASIIGLGFGYIAFEYNIWWAIFYHIFNNFVISQGLHYVAYHVDEGLANWLQIAVLAIGSIVMIVVLATKWPAIKLIFKPINLNREFSSVPSLPSGSGSSCYSLS